MAQLRLTGPNVWATTPTWLKPVAGVVLIVIGSKLAPDFFGP
jgi:hypothetical protein